MGGCQVGVGWEVWWSDWGRSGVLVGGVWGVVGVGVGLVGGVGGGGVGGGGGGGGVWVC